MINSRNFATIVWSCEKWQPIFQAMYWISLPPCLLGLIVSVTLEHLTDGSLLENKCFNLVSFLATMALPLHYYFLANVCGLAGQESYNFFIITKFAAFLSNKLFILVSFVATMALPLHYYFLTNVWGQVKNFAAKEPYHHKYWIYWTWPALTKEPNETKWGGVF